MNATHRIQAIDMRAVYWAGVVGRNPRLGSPGTLEKASELAWGDPPPFCEQLLERQGGIGAPWAQASETEA